MSRKLEGKVAIVTGASKGIGAAIARSLAAEGAAVAVNYSSGREGAEKVVADIVAAGGRAVAVKADVARAQEVKHLFTETKKAFGRLDVLVNNAGIYRFGALEQVTEKDFHDHFDTNVLGPILATREALGHFGTDGGSVINVSSVVSELRLPNASVYSSTKGALDAVTRSLSTELAGRKIRVNTIAPGGVETEGTHTAGIMGSDMEKSMISGTPLGRLGQPDDIARVAVFLASNDSQWLTGERIVASGGFR
jgi:3-oxoacyl-[acyl-carrier protein] reductase